MGLKKDIKLRGNDFGHVVTAYAIAHLVMQAPNGRSYSHAFLIDDIDNEKRILSRGCQFPYGSPYVFSDGV